MKESILDSANHGYTPSTGLIQAREAISKAYSKDNYKL
jgi:aspartate/methionine/tyrosine aminotransferase